MKEAFAAIWHAVTSLAAAAVFLGLIWFFARAHSHMWREVSARYRGRAPGSPGARKALDTIVVAPRGAAGPRPSAYRVYAGVSIAVHESGLSLTLWPPFNVMCPPLFLPFDEMEVRATSWALWPDPVALRMRGLPDIDLIAARETAQWLRAHGGGPFATKPNQ